MKRFFLLALFFVPFILFSQTDMSYKGIQWVGGRSWKEILAKANTENKYIFMDAYATWCGPCQAMATDIFPQPMVGKVINDSFIAVKVQMDSTKNDDEFTKNWYTDAKIIMEKGRLTAFPTLLFFSPDGKLVHKSVGYKDTENLIGEAKKALNPSTQFFTLYDRYKQGQLNAAQVRSLATQAKEMGEVNIASIIARGYIHAMSEKEIYQKENLVFIAAFLTGSDDPNFDIFLKERKKVNEIVESNFAENTVMRIISKEEISPYDNAEKPDWDGLEKRIIAKYGALGQERVWGHRAVYYCTVQDWNNFKNYFKKYFDRAIPNKRTFLNINSLSWNVFLRIDDPDVLASAIKAMHYAMETTDNKQVNTIDTYANLLYKTGRKKEALMWEEKAVALSNHEKDFVETLDKMKKNQRTW